MIPRWSILNNELTDTHTLRGLEAVEALNFYAHKLETHRGGDLTKSQKEFLIRTARVLSETISCSDECKPRSE